MDTTLIILISILAIAGVIFRPLKVSEYIWACAGAVLLVLLGLLTVSGALSGILKGTDVYFFLVGMMMLAEVARIEGLFDWLAAKATNLAKGSAIKLFFLIYLVGTIVTVFLSNDATAVVLTPAVIAAMKAGKVKNPMPYLLICAFIANAASFVLPISNPANLVMYGKHLPSLLQWMSGFLLPSIVSIIATFVVLFLLQLKGLKQPVEREIPVPNLSPGGKTALAGIVLSAVILLICSAKDIALGMPTFVAGLMVVTVVFFIAARNPIYIAKGISWQVLPLVAGLFVIVEALSQTGLTDSAAHLLMQHARQSLVATSWQSGILTAFACNLMNNLPAGLTASNVILAANPPELIRRAVLIGIDLGPNLSLTGSLASILWLVALRRENYVISGWSFLKTGIFVMTIPLLLVIASLFI
ncbi:arsenic transporter [Pedobacter sp. Leaf194]|uniref:arsenic transporter n=1 Tax=Pedobacter sp. Leaf194 TaxID=1736297 RepID=UPI000703907D|nr:arsenic transporter [Pedobacter sp. Leaf194]KQS36314.1 arsenic transporter [Pedobacter sp. Leaf194]